ncbi:phage Gp19/Gp15/Gp42 family protein [Finegoldia magna]|jgi:hypothetical protein|uniref:phage Gp19/Gp15/Gp42 family protein n=1 Tax=Finegoldia magna TaxID=1260 RepID=UPI00399A781E
MKGFATIEDVELLWRGLKGTEINRCMGLLETISDTLRLEAERYGIDLDKKAENTVYANVLKSVVVDIVARTLLTSTDNEPVSQFTESALGYSYTGTYLTPGGGIFIKDTELRKLGIKKQRYGVIDFYGKVERDSDYIDQQGEKTDRSLW